MAKSAGPVFAARLLLAAAGLVLWSSAAGQADLIVSSGEPTVEPMTVAAGDSVQLSGWTVANVGLLPSGDFSNGFYLSTNASISGSDTFLDGNSNLSLPAGGSFAWGGPTLTIPVGTAAGDYFIGILVDRANQVPELNETNNFAATPLTVVASLDPDLDISALSPGISDSETVPGQTVNFNKVTITNLGGGTAPGASLGYYLSTDSVITEQDQFLARRPVRSLAAGEAEVIAPVSVTVPASTGAGSYWLGALADNLSGVAEADEFNNQLAFPVTVSGGTAVEILVDNTARCESGVPIALSHHQPAGSNFDVASATRFSVAGGEVWRPERVTAFGRQNLADATTQGRVRFYSSKSVSCGPRCSNSLPDQLLCDLPVDVNTEDDLTLDLPQGHSCELAAGRVWVSVQQARSSCLLTPCETWYWDQAASSDRLPAPWVIRDIGGTVSANSCDAEWGRPEDCLSTMPQAATALCLRIEGSRPVVANRSPEAVSVQRLHSALAGEAFTLDISGYFSDPDGDALLFSQSGLPPGVELDSSTGVISGATATELGNTFYTVELTAQDPDGLSDNTFIHLRILDGASLTFAERTPETLVRCTSAPAEGVGALQLSLSFDSAELCPEPGTPACRIPGPHETMTLAEVSVSIDHPAVGDLSLSLDYASGGIMLVPAGGCGAANARAVFSDRAPWRAENRCNATGEAGLVGPLAPSQRLAGLRNLSPVQSGPFTLALSNAGSQSARINQWCMAVQVNREGLEIFPQAELPGSANTVSLVTDSAAARTGEIAYPGEVDWYRVEQDASCLRTVNVTLRPVGPAPVPQLFLESGRLASDPGFPDGSCVEAQALPDYTRSSKGFFFVRIQSCPEGGIGPYELEFQKTGFFCETQGGLGIGSVTGTVLDAASNQPLGGAWLELASGEGTFSRPGDGWFRLGATPVSSTTLAAYSAAHQTLTVGGVTVIEGETTELGQLSLDAASFPAPVTDQIFAGGFE